MRLQSRRRFILLSAFTWVVGFALAYPLLHYAQLEDTGYVKSTGDNSESGKMCELKWTDLTRDVCFQLLREPDEKAIVNCDYYARENGESLGRNMNKCAVSYCD